MTLREALAVGAGLLADGDTAKWDAELLLLDLLGMDRARRFAEPDRELSAGEEVAYRERVARRAAGEPVQYITGRQEFYGRSFQVSPAVLIPRPETELLVEAVLGRLAGGGPVRVLDVGTGSGILAITLALHLPRAVVTAVDVSLEALAVAGRNAAAHGVAGRVRFLESDLLGAVAGETFDAIVSNPPYVPLGERASLHRQVREHEPGLALFAGEDGMAAYRRLIPAAYETLRPGGLLALEIGYGQRDAVGRLLDGWVGVGVLEDLQGISRVVVAGRGV